MSLFLWIALSRSSAAVVCSGVSPVLDIPRTLEYLDTHVRGLKLVFYSIFLIFRMWTSKIVDDWKMLLRCLHELTIGSNDVNTGRDGRLSGSYVSNKWIAHVRTFINTPRFRLYAPRKVVTWQQRVCIVIIYCIDHVYTCKMPSLFQYLLWDA